jgi:hypothetical protein
MPANKQNPLRIAGFLACSLALFSAGCSGGGGGGGESNPISGPSISSLMPTTVIFGTSSLSLTVNGSDFNASSLVEWNGSALQTTYVGANQLTAMVPASDLSSAAVNTVTVANPSQTASNSASFTVAYPSPQLISISPSEVLAESSGFTLTATGANFYSGVQVFWNGTPINTTYVSAAQLNAQVPASLIAAAGTATISVSNPSPSSASNSEYVSIVAAATSLMTIPIAANDIGWDSEHSLLIASVPGVSGSTGTLVTINPLTGSQVATQPAGVTPDLISVASDDSLVWLGEDGSSAVQSFSLPSLSPGTTISLPVYDSNAQNAIGLKAAPGNPNTVAILASSSTFSNLASDSTYIYDGATPRPTNTGYLTMGVTGIEWGASSSVLYGNQGEYGTFGMDVLSVNSSGVSVQTNYPFVFDVPLADLTHIHFDAASGYVYDDDGRVIDPGTGNIVGNFNLQYLLRQYNYNTQCIVDSSQGVVFFLGQTDVQYDSFSGFTILAFDKSTYRLLRALSIPQASGNAIDFVRWGNSGLAFNTHNAATSAIYLVDGAFVNSSSSTDFVTDTLLNGLPRIVSISPESVTAGTGATALTVNGSDFLAGTTIKWNGTSLNTTMVNSGQLQATIPANDLATPGSAQVGVANSETSLSSMNTLIFTIGDSVSGLRAMNLASLNVAWDPNSQLLYGAVWGGDSQYPNSIVAVSPATQQVVKSANIGADPYMIRTSSDGKYAYVSYMASNSATQIKIPGFTSPLTWYLGATAEQGPVIAIDMQPSPFASQTTAISTGTIADVNNAYNSFQPYAYGALTIYDNNLPRADSIPNVYPTNIEFGTLQWGANDSTLYGANNGPNDVVFNLYEVNVSSSGAVLAAGAWNALNNPNLPIGPFDTFDALHFDAGTGYLYDDNGLVVDPATGSQLAILGSNGYVAVDSSLNREFVLSLNLDSLIHSSIGCTSYTINSYDAKLFTPVSSITLAGICGTPTSLVRWGASGLVLVTYIEPMDNPGIGPGMLYLINDPPFVSAGP